MAVIYPDPWPFQLYRDVVPMRDIKYAPKDIVDAFVKSIECEVAKEALGVKNTKTHGWDVAMHLQKARMELSLLVSQNRAKLEIVK